VNSYLDFTIPHTFGQPVTLRDLMTHRLVRGIDQAALYRGSDADAVPWRGSEGVGAGTDFSAGRPAGLLNYGATLAGYIVERVSGEKFADYIAHRIFQPLGMNAFDLRPAAAQKPSRAICRAATTSPRRPEEFEMVWMIRLAHYRRRRRHREIHDRLSERRGADPQTATVKLMHSEIYQRNPPVPGMGWLLSRRYERPRDCGPWRRHDPLSQRLHLIPARAWAFIIPEQRGQENSGIRGPLFASSWTAISGARAETRTNAEKR